MIIRCHARPLSGPDNPLAPPPTSLATIYEPLPSRLTGALRSAGRLGDRYNVAEPMPVRADLMGACASNRDVLRRLFAVWN